MRSEIVWTVSKLLAVVVAIAGSVIGIIYDDLGFIERSWYAAAGLVGVKTVMQGVGK